MPELIRSRFAYPRDFEKIAEVLVDRCHAIGCIAQTGNVGSTRDLATSQHTQRVTARHQRVLNSIPMPSPHMAIDSTPGMASPAATLVNAAASRATAFGTSSCISARNAGIALDPPV